MDILKYKDKIMIGFLIILIVVCGCMFVNKMNQNTLTQINKTYTHEAGEELVLNATDFFDADEEKAAKITFDTSAVDINTVGEYVATADFNGKTFEIKINVVDTKKPEVTFTDRYIITNDLENPDVSDMIASVSDASEWTTKLVRFEHKGNLDVMDENAFKGLTGTISVPCYEEEMNLIGTTDVPTEQGIYRAVLEVADVHGNVSLEEIYVIYDTTGVTFNEVADQVVRVEKDDLGKEPEIDKSEYGALDNVDGYIKAELLTYELELRDEEKHEWLVHVSYTDRAGNESTDEFLITVEEKASENKNETSNTGSGNGGNTNNSTNNDNSSNTESNTTTEKPSNNVDNTNAGYDPKDANRDGVVTEDEGMGYITPEKQACIDAGYGVVCEFNGGEWYGVLSHGDGYVDGKSGGSILVDYLEARNLQANNIIGCYINGDNDWFWWIAENVHEMYTEDDWY